MPLSTEVKFTVGFILIFILLGINAIISSANLNRIISNRKWVSHTHEVTGELENILSTLKDAETGQRGYILTGQEDYLEPYNHALPRLPAKFAHLRLLTEDNPEQQRQLPSLERQTQAKISEMEETLRLSRTSGRVAARQKVITGRGKKIMDDIRALVAQMEEAETTLLSTRAKEIDVSERKARMTLGRENLAGIILLAAFYMLVIRTLKERKRAAQDIQKREEWLSTTLRSIGDAVIATDQAGAVLFMNPLAEKLTGWTQAKARGKKADEIFVLVNETDRSLVESPIGKFLRENCAVGLANQTVLISRDGGETLIDDSAAPIRNAAGDLIGVVLVFRDITERRERERELNTAYERVNDLNIRLQRAMTETHHRVKNNLQVISAMVDMQAGKTDTYVSKEELIRLSSQIGALAAVQDLLTQEAKQQENANAISAKELLGKLIAVHQQTAPTYQITAKMEDVRLPGNQGTSLALMANELISNAIKHGRSKVDVKMAVDGNALTVIVSDDGPGFPEGFDVKQAANTGLELVDSLVVWDLKGRIEYGNQPDGGEVKVVIPLSRE